MEDICTFYPIF